MKLPDLPTLGIDLRWQLTSPVFILLAPRISKSTHNGLKDSTNQQIKRGTSSLEERIAGAATEVEIGVTEDLYLSHTLSLFLSTSGGKGTT